MTPVLNTYRPWHQRLVDFFRDHLLAPSGRASLHQLDRRTLADIGIDASEIASIEAEARGHARVTRLRIVAAARHA
jgi:uncharacterized protein YjiS (DUF1127 family)